MTASSDLIPNYKLQTRNICSEYVWWVWRQSGQASQSVEQQKCKIWCFVVFQYEPITCWWWDTLPEDALKCLRLMRLEGLIDYLSDSKCQADGSSDLSHPGRFVYCVYWLLLEARLISNVLWCWSINNVLRFTCKAKSWHVMASRGGFWMSNRALCKSECRLNRTDQRATRLPFGLRYNQALICNLSWLLSISSQSQQSKWGALKTALTQQLARLNTQHLLNLANRNNHPKATLWYVIYPTMHLFRRN